MRSPLRTPGRNVSLSSGFVIRQYRRRTHALPNTDRDEGVAQFLGFEATAARSHAYANAPCATDRNKFPVLVFSPAGFPPLALASIVEEIASHGYVVAGITHTYESAVTAFPDGRVVPMNAAWMQLNPGPIRAAPLRTRFVLGPPLQTTRPLI